MFAGAAREAVFSRADVIAKIRADFVPVALKAALVNNPPGDAEGRLYREIGRSKPAPQGICVVNSSGQALAWALSFDDETSIGAFFDYALQRYRAHPTGPANAARFMRYPGAPLADVAATGTIPPAPERHARRTDCPAHPRRVRGTLVARVVGRTVDEEGALSTDTVSQERYVEDRFDIAPALQAGLARAAAGTERVPVPADLARQIVTYAYLGQLDVRPLASPVPQHRTHKERIDLWAEPAGELLRLGGTSDVGARGAMFDHEIELDWQGFARVEGERVVDLVLTAKGRETLRWGRPELRAPAAESDCARLPAGRPIDFAGEVRYGIVATPVADEDATETAAPVATQPPAALREKMQRLQAAVRRWRRAGRDPGPVVGPAMRGFEPLLREGRFDEAEKALDGALALLEEDALPAAVRAQLRELEKSVRALIRQGRRDEAKAILDEALARLAESR